MAGYNDYSTTAASNTSINGIGVTDSSTPNTVDNMIRQLMADARAFANDIGGANVSSGTDTITLSTDTDFSGGYVDGDSLIFIAGGTNTTTATLNVDSGGAKAVRKGADEALVAGDITAAMPCHVVYDASANSASGAWMLLNPYGATLAALAAVFTPASASGAASLVLAEDTDNGSDAVTIIAPATLGGDVTFTLPTSTGTPALLGVENQQIAGGAAVTVKDLGTQSSGTLTLDMGDRPLQKCVNGGAFTLAPGSIKGSCLLTITNNGSAGAITTSGWTQVAGDSFDTTDTNKFLCSCVVDDDGDSVLVVTAYQ